jgi:hypothetical protein
MSAAPERIAFERVVVRLSAASRTDPTLEAALRLAAALDAALEGLFVEDANLLRLAALPFATEVCVLTGMRRTLAATDVERAFRLAASRHERRLAESAARSHVRWSFAVTRGDFLGEAAARGGDLIVVGPHADAGLRAGPIAVLQDGWPSASRALDAAERLARALSRGLLILVSDGGAKDDTAARSDAVTRARLHLARQDLAGAAIGVPPERPALAAALRARRGAVLVLPEAALAAWPIDLDALAAELGCPLVIAR